MNGRIRIENGVTSHNNHNTLGIEVKITIEMDSLVLDEMEWLHAAKILIAQELINRKNKEIELKSQIHSQTS